MYLVTQFKVTSSMLLISIWILFLIVYVELSLRCDVWLLLVSKWDLSSNIKNDKQIYSETALIKVKSFLALTSEDGIGLLETSKREKTDVHELPSKLIYSNF